MDSNTNFVGINCPTCNYKSNVIDSRGSERKGVIRRRRQCLKYTCKKRFTTYEIHDKLFHEIEWAEKFRKDMASILRGVTK